MSKDIPNTQKPSESGQDNERTENISTIPGRHSYQVDVPSNTASISVMPSAEQGAKITVNGKVVQSGGYSTSIGLSTGSQYAYWQESSINCRIKL
ncbi:cadherin-like beta sandwich domain-containing protein [uncultured Brevibacillus sp.]|uniref:cadherin-like beta sandwich domain-containing protein n=1 Tax=uncultured Brevibacillus sp. TaxID=169970 RepID=UPI002592988D|nr:cadherin-like beta sandwich domain-containing protein [uncultured Brevibacillus sp.]